ncbi:MAG: heme iron utilization protein, partial [Okeania sp. SIO2B9]|nr:heme iron utilization protein [Okeania sp. SIO2B9]
IRIEFDHTLKDAEDAHHTLIDMLKQARVQE